MDENEKPENKFEVELMKRMDRVIVKLEVLEKDVSGIKHSVANLEKGVSNLEKEVSEVKSDVRVIKGQFGDVAVMAIEDNKRITKLEKDVEDLQSNIH
jgi:predicted  nucleic acid-binding Zn-ribbon protein